MTCYGLVYQGQAAPADCYNSMSDKRRLNRWTPRQTNKSKPQSLICTRSVDCLADHSTLHARFVVFRMENEWHSSYLVFVMSAALPSSVSHHRWPPLIFLSTMKLAVSGRAVGTGSDVRALNESLTQSKPRSHKLTGSSSIMCYGPAWLYPCGWYHHANHC